VGKVRSLHVNGCAGGGRGDDGAGEAVVFFEMENAGDGKVIVQLLDIHVALKCSVLPVDLFLLKGLAEGRLFAKIFHIRDVTGRFAN
jgi:hypothetical protein